jgi:hypothetical protein
VQGLPGVPGGEHRQVVAQLAPGDAVEVVAVQVRQDDGVQVRQLRRLRRRLGQALGRQPVAEVRALAAVQEVGVGQHGERPQPQQRGRGADELQGVHGASGGRVIREPVASAGGGCGGPPPIVRRPVPGRTADGARRRLTFARRTGG